MISTSHSPKRSAPSVTTAVVALLCAAVISASAGRAAGQVNELPEELRGVGIVDKRGQKLPMDVALVDDTGKAVTLGDYFRQGKPVILNFGYYACPMLCTQGLNGLLTVQKQMDWTAGDKFTVLSVSFDPRDTAELAAQKKANYLAELGKPAAAAGWVFLTGRAEETKRLADAAGFTYRWVESEKQYSHGAGLIIATPDGVVSQDLGGFLIDAPTLRAALVEASGGKIASSLQDFFVMFCGRYDPSTKKYVLVAEKVMRIGGALTVGVLLTVLGTLWLRDIRRRKVTADHVQPRPA